MLTVTSALASAAPLLNQVQSANSKDILILIRYAKFKVGLKQALGMAFVPIHNHVAFFLDAKPELPTPSPFLLLVACRS